MSTNWECPNCKALNPPRRQACWQCQTARPLASQHSQPVETRAPRPFAAARRLERIDLDGLFPPAADDARIGDRLIAFVVGLAFSLAAIWIVSAPLRAAAGGLSWLGGLAALVLLLVGQWLLLTAAFVNRRLYFLQLGLLGAGGLIYILVLVVL